ncbi:MAG: hypothetical protein SGILL_004477, partial [Bacillariaceae sp.]
ILWGMLDEFMHPQPLAANHSFAGDCGYFGEPIEDDAELSRLHEEAYKYIIAKSRGAILIPLYELIQHRGGNWRNVALRESPNGSMLQVVAFRDIGKGEPLYKSFNRCDFDDAQCESWDESFTPTADLFRDAGIVEEYPRRWMIVARPGHDRSTSVFDIDKTADGNFTFKWLTGPPTIFGINFMRSHYEVLVENQEKVEQQAEGLESTFESESILKYHAALKEALHLAWFNRNGDSTSSMTDKKDTTTLDPLDKPKGVGTNLDYYFMCYTDRSCAGGEYDETLMDSMYQDMIFKHCPEADDSCLSLTGVIQACTSFRPHYHESFVHVPAQYAKEMKRVAYLGGGDNMRKLSPDIPSCSPVLHEILKYPDLELVVGLELDQSVVRYSFKHFGTSPYFHDPRVQWWFGDASKSFLALPKDYFGTFDLVVVDLLSYIADTLKVTDSLSLMDAAKLLMKPQDGVIVKQEDFSFNPISEHFAKYTVDFEFRDLPYLCRQHITMGSNSIDFMRAKRYYHGVETVVRNDYLPLSDDQTTSQSFSSWNEYHNIPDKSCSETTTTQVPTDSLSSESPQFGVLLVAEADNLKLQDENSDFVGLVNAAATKFGLSIIDTSGHVLSNRTHFLSLFQEGYITVRAFPEDKYVGFDVMMWDALDNVDGLKDALVLAIGGNPNSSTTSFRVVSGGMPGSGGGVCQKQELSRIAEDIGVCKESDGGDSAVAKKKGQAKAVMIETLLSSMITAIAVDRSLVVVVCGEKDDECASLEAATNILKDNDHGTIAPIFSCSSSTRLSACRNEMLGGLLSAVDTEKRIDSIIVDASASFQTSQSLHRILTDTVNYDALMKDEYLVLSIVPEGETWRSVFVDRFRTELGAFFDPSFRVDFRLEKEEQRMEWSVFSTGDTKFLARLASSLNDVERSTGWRFEVMAVENGVNKFIVDFDAPVRLKDSDYDKTQASQQWISQRVMGYQVVIQTESIAPRKPLKTLERVLVQTVSDGPWDKLYEPAIILQVEGDSIGALVRFEFQLDGGENVEFAKRDRIRRLSHSDTEDSATFHVGDVVLFDSGFEGTFESCMISAMYQDGEMFDLMMLNFEGRKHYGIPRRRLVPQTESPEFFEEVELLTKERLLAAYKKALSTLELTEQEEMTIGPVSFSVGGGEIAAFFWSRGNVVLKWNGGKRAELNLFLDQEKRKAATTFHETFANALGNVHAVQMDEFPRGFGNVVNFESHLKDPPHWLLQ